MLGDRRDARGQAARQPDQHVFDRRGALVLGGKHLRMVGIECEGRLAVLLLAQAIEALDGRMAVGAVLPFAGGAPLELRGLRGLGERFAGADKASTLTPLSTVLLPSVMMYLRAVLLHNESH